MIDTNQPTTFVILSMITTLDNIRHFRDVRLNTERIKDKGIAIGVSGDVKIGTNASWWSELPLIIYKTPPNLPSAVYMEYTAVVGTYKNKIFELDTNGKDVLIKFEPYAHFWALAINRFTNGTLIKSDCKTSTFLLISRDEFRQYYKSLIALWIE